MKAVHAVAGLFFSLALHALVIGAFWLFSAEKPEEEQPDPGLLSLALAEPPEQEAIEEEAVEEAAIEEEAVEEELPQPEPIEETLVEAEPEPVQEELVAEAEPEPAAPIEEVAEVFDEDVFGDDQAEPERAILQEGSRLASGQIRAPEIILEFGSSQELFEAATRRGLLLYGYDSVERPIIRISSDGKNITEHRGPLDVTGGWSRLAVEVRITGARDLRNHFGVSWNPRVRRVVAVTRNSLAHQIGSVQEHQLATLGLEPEQVDTIHISVSPDPAQPVWVVRVIRR
ncbi:MAG: hypothetical protein JJU33_00945 [Phycisphaerales bacterium]|nr:hypothetical protein [Phycisphaerales bacterium]